ncbi:RNA polymerase sigma factor [Peristeroidobacter soli]|jgi:RNA polymerase sigma-70 factor (ECF subfamily)|uniref:RNA polymerase sigma factor n=1 Tax=Peristeroidobacter soli TaxID=2497877 RepID=UPI00101DCF37|nr:RNA polymerase sigma factor [Peristeroidobacter soli]
MNSTTSPESIDQLSVALCSSQDRALVAGVLQGDQRAFNEFFNTYFARVYRFALPRLNRDHDAAREVVQATLVKGLRALPGFRFDATLFTWLCQICRRQIADYVKVNSRLRNNIVLIEDNPEIRDALEDAEGAAESDPQHAYSAEERRHLVRNILDHLPARYGDVLEWKYIDGHSVEEIGARLGLGHGAAQSLLARARVAFRQAVETVFGSTADDILAGMQ